MKLTLAFLAAVAVLAVGCGKGNFNKSPDAGGAKVFRYPIVTSPTTLDPGRVQDGDTIDLLQQVFEGLVAWNKGENIKKRKKEIGGT